MDRMILHSDINACYASIELLRHPELRGRPVAVGGERELRHGIILAKDQMARAAGVRTGMTLWAARQQCPELTILPPDFELYYDYSRRVREIYVGFTDRCEPFGMDECWLDMTGCVGREDALQTAQEVRQRVLDATGLTVSVGVSWCKAIAKLGSDYRKPNAVTVIDRAHFTARSRRRTPTCSSSALARAGGCCTPMPTGMTPRRCTALRICRRRSPSATAPPRRATSSARRTRARRSCRWRRAWARVCGWRGISAARWS